MPTKIVKKIVDGQSLAGNFFSQVIPIGPFVDNIAFNIEVFGVSTNLGTFTVEHRIRKDHAQVSAWGKLCLSFTPTLESIDDVFIIYLNQAPIGELRLVFTTTGGDGLVDIWYSGRDV
jgi:hypothetical protein